MEKLFPIITFCEGLPTEAVIHDLTDNKSHNMVVIDDLMNELLSNREMEKLFTQGAPHKKT